MMWRSGYGFLVHSTRLHLGLGDISCSMLNLFVGDSRAEARENGLVK